MIHSASDLQVEFVWWFCVTLWSALSRVTSLHWFWWYPRFSWFLQLEMLLCFSVLNTSRGSDEITSFSIQKTNNGSWEPLLADRD